MSQVNIYAFTAPGADFPEYVSINRVAGAVEITVRAPKGQGGHTATVRLLPEEYECLQAAIAAPIPKVFD
jgi:hypothetical protein